jgi:hypothetical protein
MGITGQEVVAAAMAERLAMHAELQRVSRRIMRRAVLRFMFPHYAGTGTRLRAMVRSMRHLATVAALLQLVDAGAIVATCDRGSWRYSIADGAK